MHLQAHLTIVVFGNSYTPRQWDCLWTVAEGIQFQSFHMKIRQWGWERERRKIYGSGSRFLLLWWIPWSGRWKICNSDFIKPHFITLMVEALWLPQAQQHFSINFASTWRASRNSQWRKIGHWHWCKWKWISNILERLW